MIDIIKNKDLRDAFTIESRQYVVGDLKIPQIIKHIQDKNINIGIGTHPTYNWESPHYHTECTEYQYVIKGKAKYLDLNNNTEYFVEEGDVFIIHPNTAYILKTCKDTEIIFIKHPAVNDKIDILLTEKMKKWVENWDKLWDEGD